MIIAGKELYLCGRKILIWPLGHIFLCKRSYNKRLILLFNRCILVSLFWWFYPHPRQRKTPGGHWFVRRSFFPLWGRCNFFYSVAKCGFNRRTAATKLGCCGPLSTACSIRVILFIMFLFPHLRPSHPHRGSRCTPGSSGILIDSGVFLAHPNNRPAFYKLFSPGGPPALAPNLCLPALAPNLYLPTLVPNLYLPALTPDFYLPALLSS